MTFRRRQPAKLRGTAETGQKLTVENREIMSDLNLPEQLLEKIKAAGHWQDGWNYGSDGSATLATAFRLRNGRKVQLIVDREGKILYFLNPVTYARGEPVSPGSPSFDFSPSDITALCGQRMVRSRFFPWVKRYEDFDLVQLD